MTLGDVLARVRDERVDVSRDFLINLGSAVGAFERVSGGPTPVSELTAAQVRAMMRQCRESGRSIRTTNNYRSAILYLWRLARRDGAPPLPDRDECPKIKEPKRIPTAWRPDQLAKMLEAIGRAPTKRGWGPAHWRALVMTIYDTSLRIGCLLRSDVRQVNLDESQLYVPGELMKGKRDVSHKLHPETAQLLYWLKRPDGDNRLFPWPFTHDDIWRKFRSQVLIPAGLPSTSRDQFHRIRRTSYTLVYREHGLRAAMEHASHTQDLSAFYLDPTFLPKPNPLDALPRPA